jgi:hypothetical protein
MGQDKIYVEGAGVAGHPWGVGITRVYCQVGTSRDKRVGEGRRVDDPVC